MNYLKKPFEIVNHISQFDLSINELKTFKDKNNENLAKIQESFKKVKEIFIKVNTLEESLNVLTDCVQEIIIGNEDFKTKTEQRFDDLEKSIRGN